ncbi:Thiosulfate sulfurtransferase GlpE [anaerobic digester metagenome]|jgi:rhodanese-related sulfurtransferase|uniref:Rhodanese-related sulfurtransferase n=1 Tax=Sedimentibacter saalensis TaxID=130788 RepID=A0A562J8K3_9FIRM|nr:rhodanese-like domain-containing protein [Sedimentibacter saalensis]TWH79430.1 rhodanese-related sulfurtransferase [Sedimentibacter saalensis]
MKKIMIAAAVLAILALALTGCSKSTEEESVNEKIQYVKISPKDAKEIMDNEESIVLDVRTKDEYDQGHIEGAVLLPVDEISSKAEEVLKDKKAKILVYCRSGNRSATAAKTLIKMGYENVLDFGGIIDWPYEIVK